MAGSYLRSTARRECGKCPYDRLRLLFKVVNWMPSASWMQPLEGFRSDSAVLGHPPDAGCTPKMSCLTVVLYWQTVPDAHSLFRRPFKGVLQQLTGLINRSVSVVAGLNRQLVLRNGPFALAGNVEDLPHLDVAPDFGPDGIPIPGQRVAISVHAGLVITLFEKELCNAISRERARRSRSASRG